MTEAEKAYEAAEREIAKAIESGAEMLNFRAKAFRALEVIPPQIAEAKSVIGLLLIGTQVSDLSPIAGMRWMRTLDVERTQVSDLSPIAGMTGMTTLNLSDTQVSNISHIAGMTRMTTLNLSGTQVSDISHIAGMTGMIVLFLSGTQVSDISHIAGMTGMTTLFLSNTRVSDISPVTGMTGMSTLFLDDSQVMDLRPVRSMQELVDEPFFRGLTFEDTPACRADAEIDRISQIENHSDRARALFAYLEDWVPPGEKQTPPTKAPLTIEALLEPQDQMGWRFSAGPQSFELFVVGGELDEKQQKYASQAAQRLHKLIEKLQTGNCYGFRQDILDEALEFLENLENQDEPLSEQALDLWASLIAMGTMLEANDTAKREGRDPFDLLKADERAALQTFMSVASNLVRSFPETKDLDDAQLRFNRSETSAEAILYVIQQALTQEVLKKDSGALIDDVAKLSEQDGVQGDKAKSVTANGAKNLVTAAAMVATFTGGGLISGVTGDIGGDLSDHYELGEKSARYLDSLGKKLMELIDGMPPDERANLISMLEDMRDTRQRRKDEEEEKD